jgi:hypothetical protein
MSAPEVPQFQQMPLQGRVDDLHAATPAGGGLHDRQR